MVISELIIKIWYLDSLISLIHHVTAAIFICITIWVGLYFLLKKNSTFNNTLREFKLLHDKSFKICVLGTFTNATILQLFRGFLKIPFLRWINKEALVLSKKNISENWMIDWTLVSLADPPLGFVLNVKILPLKWHNGGERAQGGWKLKEFRKTKQLQSCMAMEEEMVEEGA